MTCYKCGTDQDLSIKKRQRGIITYICRPCRRQDQRSYLNKTLEPFRAWSDDWERAAKESYATILKLRCGYSGILTYYENRSDFRYTNRGFNSGDIGRRSMAEETA
jgi:hypothetical protein